MFSKSVCKTSITKPLSECKGKSGNLVVSDMCEVTGLGACILPVYVSYSDQFLLLRKPEIEPNTKQN